MGQVVPTATGSRVSVNAAAASGTAAITVPADADFATVEVAGYHADTTPANITGGQVSIGGTGLANGKKGALIGAQIDAPDDGDQAGAFGIVAPPTGAQTFAWQWGEGAWSDGGGVVIKFWKGVDQTTPTGASGGAGAAGSSTSETMTSPALAVAAGDYIDAVGYKWPTNATVTWTGVTADLDQTVNSSNIVSASAAQAASGNVAVSLRLASASALYVALFAFVIKAAQATPQTLDLGHAAASGTVRGLDLAAGAATLAPGRVAGAASVRGVNVQATGSFMELGHATAMTTVRGLDLAAGPATLDVGRVAGAATVRGLDVVESGTYGTLVPVGRGVMDSQRSIVRDDLGRVWIFAAEDRPYQGDTSEEARNFLRAYRADQTGIPSTFTEQDTANRPLSDAVANTLSVPDVRLDSHGVVHMVWTTWTQQLWYCTFDTTANGGHGAWGAPTQLAPTGLNLPAATSWRRSHYSAALAIDADDTLHVVYTAGAVVGYLSKPYGGAWTGTTQVASGQTSPDHPNLIATATGDLHVVWIHDQAAATSSIRYQSRIGGAWLGAAETVSTGALNNTDLDQTPAVALLEDGTPIVLYLDSGQVMQTRTRTGAGAWSAADGPGFDTHAPGLYVQGDDVYLGEGHTIGTNPDIQSAYCFKLAGQGWSSERVLTQNTDQKDGSASIRYETHRRDPWPQFIDVAYMDEDIGRNATDSDPQHYAEVYYAALQPARITLGRATATPTVRGLDLAPGASSLHLGHASAGATVRGLDLASAGAQLDLGHAAATATVRGLDLAASGSATVELGRVVAAPAVRGVSLEGAGAAVIALSIATATPTVRGLDLLVVVPFVPAYVRLMDEATAQLELADVAADVTLDDARP